MALYREVAALVEEGASFALATVVETRGSTPQPAGAKAVFLPDGRVLGTLGGGCLEAEIRRRAIRALGTGEALLFEAALDDDFGWDDGLICGGQASVFVEPDPRSVVWPLLAGTLEADARVALILESPDPSERGARAVWVGGTLAAVDERARATLALAHPAGGPEVGESRPHVDRRGDVRFYVEPILRPPRLIVCGAGHVGQATARLAAWSGFEVTVVDDRPEFASRERFPDAAEVIVDDPAELVARAAIDERTYVVIVTRGHRHDAVVLRQLVRSRAAYVGMIGSKRKVRVVMEGFALEGVATPDELARVRSPIGLDIGAVSVEEIALSIVAELVAVRRGRESTPPLSATGRFAEQLSGVRRV